MAEAVHTAPDEPLPDHPAWLAPGLLIDSDHPDIRARAAAVTAGAADDREKAVRLFNHVRDGWRYDPFNFRLTPGHHKASTVLAADHGYCITKAVLLSALARAAGIPSAVGLADVTNHLTSEKLTRQMGGSTLFVDHGFSLLKIDGRWVKAAPAFNIELCERFGVTPTEFDGRSDAILQEFDARGRRHMEYLRHHGAWSDLPFDKVERDFRAAYAGSDLMRAATAPDDGAAAAAAGDDPFATPVRGSQTS
ncbi:transglutaminase-like domain-containing protein [Phreatobacter sp.]|uniref:transglutaminase-like domain-containing protein n=1 Tax=Phreatobacter sp. TaxID=1966341 RepID=UPI003F6F54E9